MFRRVAGRPVLPRMDLAAQRRRTMLRCQRRIVSGVTSSRSPWRRAFGITLSRVARSARSAQFSFGRRGCRRCRTVSWWRRIKISAVFHVSSRRDSRSHVASRMIRRNTNRRHMIDEQEADRLPGHAAGVRLADMDDPAAELAAYFQARTPVPDQELIQFTGAARTAGHSWASIAAACQVQRRQDFEGIVSAPGGRTPHSGAGLLYQATQGAVERVTRCWPS